MNKNQKKIIFSITLFTITLLILGIPYTKWGFSLDAFGHVYRCLIKSFHDLFLFFYEGSTECIYLPSNSTHTKEFFCGLYRPMSLVFCIPQGYFFGINPYGYFLTSITFHAINSVLLFNIFTAITPIFFSFLAAAYFAFHPSLFKWIGHICPQQYHIELTILLLTILLLKKYLDTKKIKFYIISCVLLLSNLFLKEATVIFALWSIPATYLYKKINKNNQISSWKNIKNSILISIPYWIITIFYLTIRAIILPITSNTGTLNFEPNWASFINRMKERFFDFVSYGSDLLGLTILPQKHQIIKGTLIMIPLLIFLYLFIKNSKKIYIIFLVFSIIIFSWPVILVQYQPRYIHMAVAFFIFTVLVLFQFSQRLNLLSKYKKTGTIFLITLIIINSTFLIKTLTSREKELNHVMTSFQKLIKNKKIKNAVKNKTSLYFFNLPRQFIVGTAQAMWLFTKNSSYKVYQYSKSINNIKKFISNIKSNNPKEKFLFITWDYENKEFMVL
ncbi:hypothetical protein KAT08_02090 [Candidatus Babeliales bacterium]|nr:hypothetical protein [Candidatus Babeliales bacterium]